jgi:hypothetical protein
MHCRTRFTTIIILRQRGTTVLAAAAVVARASLRKDIASLEALGNVEGKKCHNMRCHHRLQIRD